MTIFKSVPVVYTMSILDSWAGFWESKKYKRKYLVVVWWANHATQKGTSKWFSSMPEKFNKAMKNHRSFWIYFWEKFRPRITWNHVIMATSSSDSFSKCGFRPHETEKPAISNSTEMCFLFTLKSLSHKQELVFFFIGTFILVPRTSVCFGHVISETEGFPDDFQCAELSSWFVGKEWDMQRRSRCLWRLQRHTARGSGGMLPQEILKNGSS